MESSGADWRALAHAEQLLELHRNTEAEQRFREVLAADPGSGPALLGLARSLNRQDRHAEAEQAVRNALALDPEDPTGHHLLTDILCDRGDGRGALASARRALQVDPTSFTSHYQHGRALMMVPERSTWALRSAERAVEIDPHNADGHNLLGMCLAEAGEHQRGEDAFRTALSIDPTHAYAQNNLAVVAAAHGRLGRAARLLRSAAAAAPQESMLHSNLDRVLAVLGQRLVLVLILSLLLVASVATLGVPWWTRALVGMACLTVAGAMVLLLRRRLPRGFLAPSALWRRSTWRTRASVGFLVLLTAAVGFTALAPEAPLTVDVADVVRVTAIVSVVALVTTLRARDGDA